MRLIWLDNSYNGQIVFSALEKYLEQLEHDKRTRYDGDPRWCEEDRTFLEDAIGRTLLLKRSLKSQFPDIVTKG